jgi:TnpA family transposase
MIFWRQEDNVPSAYETAYPRLKSHLSPRELAMVYTPTEDEVTLAEGVTRSDIARVGFLVLLKTFQRLGYFVQLRDVPPTIMEHIAQTQGFLVVPDALADYDASGTRRRHVPLIRAYQHVNPFGVEGQVVLRRAVREAAYTKEALADIINVALEELVRQGFELPGFTTIREEAERGRAEVNRRFYAQVYDALGAEGRQQIDRLWTEPGADARTTVWNTLKQDAGSPTLSHLKTLVDHHQWLSAQQPLGHVLSGLPAAKMEQFAAEARSLDAARMQALEPHKRYTLAAVLLRTQWSRVLDDLGQMFTKRMMRIHRRGKEALALHQLKHQERTDGLIRTLRDVVTAYHTDGDAHQRLAAIESVIADKSAELLEQCDAHEAHAGHNYYPFLWRFYASHRPTLFRIWGAITMKTTSQDASLEHALAFILAHEHSRSEWLPLMAEYTAQPTLDLSWVPDTWWQLVTGQRTRDAPPRRVNRRHLEVCVLTQLMWDLKSGDACIEGSAEFADYREQLVSWDEYTQIAPAYGEQVSLPIAGDAFVAQLRDWLDAIARATDQSFPENEGVRLENGAPVLTKLPRRAEPAKLRWLERTIARRLEPIQILDALADTEHLLHWTRFLGLLSGHEAKIDSPRERYLMATFCYGCNLGPSQTARSLKEADRRQIAWVNQRHITEEHLDQAVTTLINAYNQFNIPKLWGSGKHASADGTKWDLYEQNLLSEYHIRYGGYGGIGYYHVSDTYIALFSHFIPCGVWEAVHILDGLLKNTSDIQPDTLHADTQGQNAPVFGLAHLLGIQLMPRIRNWKELTLYRPDHTSRYAHTDALFTDTVDWDLIRTHVPDMLRVAVSIKAGRITASTILRRLGTYSRRNKLYLAFRELGRVVRTGFLLRYLADQELRSTIQAATNKSEQFNRFLKWVFFGGEGVITENSRDAQRKVIKYNHLVANCLIFHNVCSLTRLISQLQDEGEDVPETALARISPYLTEHINRFGDYVLNMDRKPPQPAYDFKLRARSVATG